MDAQDPSSLKPDFVLRQTDESNTGAKEIVFCYPASKQRRAYIGELSAEDDQHSWRETSKEQAELHRLRLLGSGYRVDHVSAAIERTSRVIFLSSTCASSWASHQEPSRVETEAFDPDVFEYGLTDT